MKQIMYFLSVVLVAAMSACTGQYDNIDQYATDETVYVGKYNDLDPAAVSVGYNRLEIDLTDVSTGRVTADQLYMGKAKRTVIEYEEANIRVRKAFDSLCSWINVTGLTSSKTYIIKIYTEDAKGNKSVAVEALGKPFTNIDVESIPFPLPNVYPAPSFVECRWPEGFNSSLYKFIEMEYWVYDKNNVELKHDKLNSKVSVPNFSVTDLVQNDSINIAFQCRVIPIMESGRILDTITIRDTLRAGTMSMDDYLNSKQMRKIESALINSDGSGTITFNSNEVPDHQLIELSIKWTKKDRTQGSLTIKNTEKSVKCENILLGEKFEICALYGVEGSTYPKCVEGTTFKQKYTKEEIKNKKWVVLPHNGYYSGWGTTGEWRGGHPMNVFDDDIKTGWHTFNAPARLLPQALTIDMQVPTKVSAVNFRSSLHESFYGYCKHVEMFVTNVPPISIYESNLYTINWDQTKQDRWDSYDNWIDRYKIKDDESFPPLLRDSWGFSAARELADRKSANMWLVASEQRTGRFLILLFPDSADGATDGTGHIYINELEVYHDGN
jgi:hypothetical protein